MPHSIIEGTAALVQPRGSLTIFPSSNSWMLAAVQYFMCQRKEENKAGLLFKDKWDWSSHLNLLGFYLFKCISNYRYIDRISVMKNQFLFMVWFIKYLQISFTCDQQLLKGFSVDWYISLYMWILTLEPVFCHFNVKLRVSWLICQYKEKTDLNWTGRGQHWTWCTTLDRIHLRFILP